MHIGANWRPTGTHGVRATRTTSTRKQADWRNVMDNKVIDRYTLELEALSEHEHSPLPVRCIATNTADNSTAEAWLSLEMTRALLSFAYDNQQTFTEHFMQQ